MSRATLLVRHRTPCAGAPPRQRASLDRPTVTLLLSAVLLGAGIGASARAGTWSVEVEPVFLSAQGNDRHAATVTAVDGGGVAANRRSDAVLLDTDDALGYRAGLLYDRGAWSYGLDFTIFRTDQQAATQRQAADGPSGAVTTRRLDVAGRTFTSTGPGEVLYFQRLEDTTIELWIADLYAARLLAESDRASLRVLLGLRNADFDNDFRAIAGLESVGGVRIDASSNYSRMLGPMVGLASRTELGRHTLTAELRQSVVLGEVELQRSLRDFDGPPGPYAVPPEEVPAPAHSDRFTTGLRDIAVPMTDLRLAWSVALGRRFTVGLAAGATAWWDLSVPPGIRPGAGNETQLEEATLVTYGLAAKMGFGF